MTSQEVINSLKGFSSEELADILNALDEEFKGRNSGLKERVAISDDQAKEILNMILGTLANK